MFKMSLAAGLVAVSAAAASAGGYAAPVVETPVIESPLDVAPVASYGNDWTGFYAGLQGGKTDGEIDYPAGFVPSDIDVDARNYGVHAGYLRDYGRFVGGAELSYDRLDDFEFDGLDLDDELGEVDGNLLRGKLLAGYDAGRWLPYAAIGLARAEIDSPSGDATETGFAYGLGAKFMATPRFMVGLEWMNSSFEVDEDVDDDGVDDEVDWDFGTISVNASFRF
jgi:opacity protein-like surface antigen